MRKIPPFILKISTIKRPLNIQADKFDGQIFSMGIKSPSILRMTEWLQSKLSEQLHSIMKEPQMTACGHYFRMGKFRGIGLRKYVNKFIYFDYNEDIIFLKENYRRYIYDLQILFYNLEYFWVYSIFAQKPI